MLKTISYKFNKGPISKEELQEEKFTEGNCRLAIQYYFYKIHNLFIEPNNILNPQGYNTLGTFIIEEKYFKNDSFVHLKEGDIIYAERIINAQGEKILKSYSSKDDWIIALHSAIYLGNDKIYHCTSIDKKSCVWSIKKFLDYYKPIAAKRLLV